MHLMLWHGWLLDGSGSNVYTARAAEALRGEGVDVTILCQVRRPAALPFCDEWGTVDADGVRLEASRDGGAPGRLRVLRPEIGPVLPVFVYDAYEGFVVKRFPELGDEELETYLERNAAALRAAAEATSPDGVLAGHSVPGPPVARRALGAHAYAAKVHGSDLEYAVKLQRRYRDLAAEGLSGARAVTGTTRSLLERTAQAVPEMTAPTIVAPPGVDPAFRPRERPDALSALARDLDGEPRTAAGRAADLDDRLWRAVRERDAAAVEALAGEYDQDAPDRDAAQRLRALAGGARPLVAYIGKFIPQKGVELLLQALATLDRPAHGLVIGFGSFREWLAALTASLDAGDPDATRWVAERSGMQLDLDDGDVRRAAGLARRVSFTGRLDHRYAPDALAAADVLVVPSILAEAFGMVVIEGAAAGAIPLVARHSGLAEVATAIETAVGVPGLCTFEPGPGAVHRVRDRLEELLARPAEERSALRRAVSEHARREFSWARTGRLLLEAATRPA